MLCYLGFHYVKFKGIMFYKNISNYRTFATMSSLFKNLGSRANVVQSDVSVLESAHLGPQGQNLRPY